MYLDVNGTRLYYEKTGDGAPFILLHGNGEDHTIFDMLIPELSKYYSVYAVDSRGHGQSDRATELSYDTMACDIAEFIQKLGLIKPILYGFSDGGIIGLILAICSPHMLSLLIVSGANTQPSGIRFFPLLLIKAVYFLTRSAKMKLMLTEPDIKKEDLNKIKTPAVILAGSRDLIKQSHTEYIAENIPGSTLQILKGEDHSSYVIHSKKLFNIIKPYIHI